MSEPVKEALYKEIGANYRFFLTWRHASFAGGLAVLWGTCSLLLSAYDKGTSLACLIPLLGALVMLCLWIADLRTQRIYRELVSAGKALEAENEGAYHALDKAGIPKESPWFAMGKSAGPCRTISHSFALKCFFLGSSIILLIVAIFLFFSPPRPKSSDSEQRPKPSDSEVRQILKLMPSVVSRQLAALNVLTSEPDVSMRDRDLPTQDQDLRR